jgi:hypothetical protein
MEKDNQNELNVRGKKERISQQEMHTRKDKHGPCKSSNYSFEANEEFLAGVRVTDFRAAPRFSGGSATMMGPNQG